jgi:hypothetical protein
MLKVHTALQLPFYFEELNARPGFTDHLKELAYIGALTAQKVCLGGPPVSRVLPSVGRIHEVNKSNDIRGGSSHHGHNSIEG